MSLFTALVSRPRKISRYYIFLFTAAIFLVCSLIVRIGLIIFENTGPYSFTNYFEIFFVGMIYDLAAFTWFLIPFALIAWITPGGQKGCFIHGVLSTGLFVLFISLLVFQSVSEFIFWNEFSARFNFIAVDYLIYTREVIGNIKQSYPVNDIFIGISILIMLILFLTVRRFWFIATSDSPRFRKRTLFLILSLSAPAIVFFGLDESFHMQMKNPALKEFSSNGSYSFFRAFRNNNLDYKTFYATLDSNLVDNILKQEVEKSDKNFIPAIHPNSSNSMSRHIVSKNKQIPLNVILVSIESLGSDYVDAFGGTKGLTPNLNNLAKKSLIFTNLYATGLRTVRGLEALTLSLPPTPGRAVIMREKNKGLQTLGGVMKDHGYDPYFFYGGYSIFDNMKDFFAGNGYTVIDRTAIPEDEISHETIWGVADEDLYKHVLKKLEERNTGKPFFAHIMTTSNHRPYTYPHKRVSIPSGTGRDGAVQYTDWAIGNFLQEAQSQQWFNNTIFIFVADHTSHGRGRIDLPPENYHIPLIFYAPDIIQPQEVDSVASLIDVGPTLLAMLNIEYDSYFFGQNILNQDEYHPRAFMANYLTVGYMKNNQTVELGPQGYIRVVDAKTGVKSDSNKPETKQLIEEAISYYQSASEYIKDSAKAYRSPN